jgi:plasmid stabilization system protein ParE
MPHLIWSPPALEDIQRLYRFLAEKNPEAAKRAVKDIRAGVKLIERFPEIGRPAGNMQAEFREWLIRFGESGYVVL